MEGILHQLRLVVYSIIYRVLYIPGGAGFLPSTIVINTSTASKITNSHPNPTTQTTMTPTPSLPEPTNQSVRANHYPKTPQSKYQLKLQESIGI